MNQQQIQSLLEAGLPGAEIHVRGEDGVHFEAIVISRVRRPKLAESPSAGLLGPGRAYRGEIHALALKTFTPQEWAQQQSSDQSE